MSSPSWGYIEFGASKELTAASFVYGCRARGRRPGSVFGISDVWEPLETDGSGLERRLLRVQPGPFPFE